MAFATFGSGKPYSGVTASGSPSTDYGHAGIQGMANGKYHLVVDADKPGREGFAAASSL